MRFSKLWRYSSIARAALEATSGNASFTGVTRRKSPSSEINFFLFPDTKLDTANQDFVRPCTVHAPTAPLDIWVWDLVLQTSYNPDLFPSDFHVFDLPKTYLQGRRFSSDDIVKSEIRKWLEDQDDLFYSLGLENFIVSYDMCFKTSGDYVDQSRTGIET